MQLASAFGKAQQSRGVGGAIRTQIRGRAVRHVLWSTSVLDHLLMRDNFVVINLVLDAVSGQCPVSFHLALALGIA